MYIIFAVLKQSGCGKQPPCMILGQVGCFPQPPCFIAALTNAKGSLNYADLFIQTRAAVRKLRSNQSPQFEPLGNFNPYTRFLNGVALGRPNRFEVFQQDSQNWFVKCGTIHGLSLHTHYLDLYTLAPNSPKVGTGKLVAVGGSQSQFEWTTGNATDIAANYRAVIFVQQKSIRHLLTK